MGKLSAKWLGKGFTQKGLEEDWLFPASYVGLHRTRNMFKGWINLLVPKRAKFFKNMDLFSANFYDVDLFDVTINCQELTKLMSIYCFGKLCIIMTSKLMYPRISHTPNFGHCFWLKKCGLHTGKYGMLCFSDNGRYTLHMTSMDRGQLECCQALINLTLCLVLNLANFNLELQSNFLGRCKKLLPQQI